MYLMYVDESGDPGIVGSPTRYFVLTGVVIHERSWRSNLEAIVSFRQRMRNSFGLKLREEIHSAHFINKPGELKRIKRNDRLSILRFFADEIPALSDITIINVLVDKHAKPVGYDPFEMAWTALIQRFENTIVAENFPGSQGPNETGLIIPDGLPQEKLTRLVRKMRRYNPIPNQGAGYRHLPLRRVIEDPFYKDSQSSLIIQVADLCAYLCYQFHEPNSYMRKSGGDKYFKRLEQVLCRVASPNSPFGIVKL